MKEQEQKNNISVNGFRVFDQEILDGRITYDKLFRIDDNIILCNNISSDDDFIEDFCNQIEVDEEGECYEVMQYFIVDNGLAAWLTKYTSETVIYFKKLDLNILCVYHCGTGWDYVNVDFDYKNYLGAERYAKVVNAIKGGE